MTTALEISNLHTPAEACDLPLSFQPLFDFHGRICTVFSEITETNAFCEILQRIAIAIASPLAYLILSSIALLGLPLELCFAEKMESLPIEKTEELRSLIADLINGYETKHAFTIRKVKPADCGKMKAAVERINKALDWEAYTPTLKRSLNNNSSNTSIYAAFDHADEVMGYALYCHSQSLLRYIAVDLKAHGQDIGTSLMLKAIYKAADLGKPFFSLDYRAQKYRTKRFYEEKYRASFP